MNFIKEYFSKLCCKHDWEERYNVTVYEYGFSIIPIKHKVTLICKKCGKIKKIEL